jgi:Glycosyl transferase family 2
MHDMPYHRRCDLSVIIPALNEGESISELVRRVQSRLRALGITFEIIVVDGGSTDETCHRPSKPGRRLCAKRGMAMLRPFWPASGWLERRTSSRWMPTNHTIPIFWRPYGTPSAGGLDDRVTLRARGLCRHALVTDGIEPSAECGKSECPIPYPSATCRAAFGCIIGRHSCRWRYRPNISMC